MASWTSERSATIATSRWATREACDDGNTDEDDQCTPACQLPECGDGYLAPGEECDDSNLADDDACTPECLLAECGDGYVAPGEECDDGNLEDGDECTPACLWPECGDGYLARGEECDDGNPDDDCSSACLLLPGPLEIESIEAFAIKGLEFSWTESQYATSYTLLSRPGPSASLDELISPTAMTTASVMAPLLCVRA